MTTISMMRIPSWLTVIVAVVLAAFGCRAISAQDKYTVHVPNGLGFSAPRRLQDGEDPLKRKAECRGSYSHDGTGYPA